jgi:predicted O-methyltransferase YrrM
MSAREQIAEFLRNPPNLHTADSGLTNWGVDATLVSHLERLVQPGARTLETGSGISTLALLALGAEHRAVSPDAGEPERIRSYCQQKGISTASYTHIVARSEQYLPTLEVKPELDLVLVDGDHAFPIPCIDWFYASRLLKKGGVAIVDDTQLWTGAILADFLSGDNAWETVARTPRYGVYRLQVEASEAFTRWWGQQPYVVEQSQPKEPDRAGFFKRLRAR